MLTRVASDAGQESLGVENVQIRIVPKPHFRIAIDGLRSPLADAK